MIRKSLITFACTAGLLLPLASAMADDVDTSHPKHFVKDSAITVAVKSKLAAEHLKSLTRIRVDTDDNGIVWLSGFAGTGEEAHKAELIARQTDGVRAVKNDIVVKEVD